MFRKFAAFWIDNAKLTIVIMIMMVFAGIFSWLTLPKQYNPDIVVPAFQITIPAPGFSSQEVSDLIVKPFENKLMEIEGVEHVYGYANRDFGSLMVSFFVGQDKEKATTRLYNKIMTNMELKPLGVQEPLIKSIDPDEIPVYTLAITANGDTTKEELREFAWYLVDEFKLVKDVSSIYVIGGAKNNINIRLDLARMQNKKVSVMQVYNAVKNNNIVFPGGDLIQSKNNIDIVTDASLDSLDKVGSLTVKSDGNSSVYLRDIATIDQGVSQDIMSAKYQNTTSYKEAVFIGIAKRKGSNTVSIVRDIQKKKEQIQERLPSNISIVEIQNEGDIAASTTNQLIINLIQSVLIVVLVLSLFIGGKNALNVAISIPLTLSIIFLFARIVGDNINRITLFALILVLGMLVDDATVVVENVNRHMQLRSKTGKTKIQAVFDAINEVEIGVILSTVTRLLAFFAMFFVTGMMGEYMGPIPKYAIVAMVTSTAIALSINPFLAYYLSKKPVLNQQIQLSFGMKYFNILKKKYTHIFSFIMSIYGSFQSRISHLQIRQRYFSIMHRYLDPNAEVLRKKFKITFWIALGFVIILPVYFGIFKGRMLPKSDQQQMYLWVDAPQSANINQTKDIAHDIQTFLSQYFPTDVSHGLEKYTIIKDVSYWIGQAPMMDFANTFRGASSRQDQHYISMRINLLDKDHRGITSEAFVIYLRPLLKTYLLSKYPDIKVRLLEDPPGPPVRSTFLLKVGAEPQVSYQDVEKTSDWLLSKIAGEIQKLDVVDLYTSKESYKTNYTIKIDHEMVSRLGLSAQQVSFVLYQLLEGSEIDIYHTQDTKEASNIYMQIAGDQKVNISDISKISFINAFGQLVYLSEIADIIPDAADPVRYSDERIQTVYIYGEIGDNSVVYPVLKLFKLFKQDDFLEGKFTVLKHNLYGYTLQESSSGRIYTLRIGGEWELTMDTFRDMGTAMIIAFLAIYLMMVAQFKSFGLGGVIMTSFLLGFFGVFPGFSLLYIFNNEYFSATSMIGVIALAGIVVGNAILLLEYVVILLKRGVTLKMALIDAGWTRMKPIFITSLTTILGATTILGDPVWGGLAWAIIWGLLFSSLLIVWVLPIFLYKPLNNMGYK